MTTLREAAEMALKALIEYEEHEEQEYGFHRKMAEIDALGGTPPAIVALRAALAEPMQEPVYLEVCCDAHPNWLRVNQQQFDEYVAHGWEGRRLFAAPSQRKPLTEEEIDSIWDSEKAFADIYAITRAIERAHGIKE